MFFFVFLQLEYQAINRRRKCIKVLDVVLKSFEVFNQFGVACLVYTFFF
jgi:hypothetical protein